MAGFKNVGAWADSFEQGRTGTYTFYKIASSTINSPIWQDFTMTNGSPPYNYYATSPLEAALFDKRRGIYVGEDVAPAKKFLATLNICSTFVAAQYPRFILLDYLMYYPFIDGTAIGVDQTMINDISLPRYSDGAGVMAMVVAQASGNSGTGNFTVTYINQDGVEKVSPPHLTGTLFSTALTSIITSRPIVSAATGPFLSLASGDTGIRSVVSINFNGDVGGVYSIVLVKPLVNMQLTQGGVPYEKNFIKDSLSLPEIKDGACLGFAMESQTNTVITLTGLFTTIWSE